MKNISKVFVLSLFIFVSVVSLNAKPLTKEKALEIVSPFYEYLSGIGTKDKVISSFDKNWKSYYGNGKKDFRTLNQTLGFLSGPFKKMVPDLKWEIKDILVSGNSVIVRGEGSGTTALNTFITSEVKKGKSFKIMSIDIHTIENGKIVKTFHVEDYRTAFKQLGIVKPFKKKKK